MTELLCLALAVRAKVTASHRASQQVLKPNLVLFPVLSLHTLYSLQSKLCVIDPNLIQTDFIFVSRWIGRVAP